VVIHTLNPILRGWADFHRHIVSKETFRALDDWVWRRLWRWAVREHPKHNAHWIYERYFTTQGARRSVFCANKYVEKGKIRTFQSYDEKDRRIDYPTIFRMETVPIVRHVKIRGEAHPFDRRYEEYLEGLCRRRQAKKLARREKQLFKRQAGRCPQCGERLEERDTWEIHHVQFRVNGGDDALDNLQLLHLNCHHQVHQQAAAGFSPPRRSCERLEPRCRESGASGS